MYVHLYMCMHGRLCMCTMYVCVCFCSLLFWGGEGGFFFGTKSV